MNSRETITYASAALGIGVLVWLIKSTQVSPDAETQIPAIPNQLGDSVAFPRPNYTDPDYLNPASAFSPNASRLNFVPNPVASQPGAGPTYLTYNFGSDGDLQFPVIGAIKSDSPQNLPLSMILRRAKQIRDAAVDACCCDDKCSDSAPDLMSGPSAFLTRLFSTVPDFTERYGKNIASSGLAVSNLREQFDPGDN